MKKASVITLMHFIHIFFTLNSHADTDRYAHPIAQDDRLYDGEYFM